MNLRQRTSRYGAGVMFACGVAGLAIIAAGLRSGFRPETEIWLSAALVVVVILHARMGFALSRAQAELEMLQKLESRCAEDPDEAAKKIAPLLSVESAGLSDSDRAMLGRVRSAIEGGRVDLYLQPIVSLPQRKIRFYEAFSRLRDNTGAVLRPADYLEAAERANKIGVIDNLILLRTVQSLSQLRERDPKIAVFCNVSPATLFDAEFFNHFSDYLEMSGDLSAHLVFEFTYPAVQMLHPQLEVNLDALARRGYAFSVDHVLSLDLDWQALREKNFRYVKAPSDLLLAAAGGDEDAAEKLRRFRQRVADADIDLIAEKIELEGHMPEILSLGIDYGQGNLFGPARIADFYIGQTGEQPAPQLAIAS